MNNPMITPSFNASMQSTSPAGGFDFRHPARANAENTAAQIAQQSFSETAESVDARSPLFRSLGIRYVLDASRPHLGCIAIRDSDQVRQNLMDVENQSINGSNVPMDVS